MYTGTSELLPRDKRKSCDKGKFTRKRARRKLLLAQKRLFTTYRRIKIGRKGSLRDDIRPRNATRIKIYSRPYNHCSPFLTIVVAFKYVLRNYGSRDRLQGGRFFPTWAKHNIRYWSL